MTPLARWKNYKIENLKFILNLYKEEYSEMIWKNVDNSIEEEVKGYKQTGYQQAGQLGLEYKEGKKTNIFKVQDYLKTFNDEELSSYLKFWFMTYYAPNIRVNGDETPCILYTKLLKDLINSNNNRINETKHALFNNGSSEILRNCFISFGDFIYYDKDTTEYYIKPSDLDKIKSHINMIESLFPIPKDYKSNLEFFNRYKEDNYNLFLNIYIKNKKLPHNRIIYGAPGTGKSYKLEKEGSKIFPQIISEREEIKEIYQEDNNKNYWLVGATWGRDDKFDEFISNEYWENGYKDKYLEKVELIKVGDYIGIKSLNRHTNSTKIKALGIVTETGNKKIGVKWLIIEEKEYSKRRYNLTIHKVNSNRLDMFNPLIEYEKEQGKEVETVSSEIKTISRVTFYDGYTHGQFVGTYKPIPSEDGVTYKYVAGPFIKQLIEAIKNPNYNYCLVIEEINRARADKVFGNIFQLLDRDKSGKSQYPVELSEDQIGYFTKELEDEYGEELEELLNNGLSIPSNLYIWATMNSADQGVYPLDSAFKRRWNFEHIGLDDNEKEFKDGDKKLSILYQFKNDSKYTFKAIEWNNFRKVINNILLENGIQEDRLIAPFFINTNQFIQDKEKYLENIHELETNVYIDKVIMYLFEDVLRHKNKSILFNESFKSFSQLKKAYKDNLIENKDFSIFDSAVLEELRKYKIEEPSDIKDEEGE